MLTTQAAFSGNTHKSWPFIKPAAAAPVVEAPPADTNPFPALKALFLGDKAQFEAFLHIASVHVQCMDPLDLQVKSNENFKAAPRRIPVGDFAGKSACRIKAFREAIPQAVKKVFHGRGSHGFRNYISLAAAQELEEVATELAKA